jgi:hypothetical protein
VPPAVQPKSVQYRLDMHRGGVFLLGQFKFKGQTVTFVFNPRLLHRRSQGVQVVQLHPLSPMSREKCQQNAQNATIEAFSAHETYELYRLYRHTYLARNVLKLAYGNLGSKHFAGKKSPDPQSAPPANNPGYAYGLL